MASLRDCDNQEETGRFSSPSQSGKGGEAGVDRRSISLFEAWWLDRDDPGTLHRQGRTGLWTE